MNGMAVAQIMEQILTIGIIKLMVLFVTIYIIWQIIRYTLMLMPSLGFNNYFDNVVVNVGYAGLMSVCNMIFHWIIACLLVIYIVWWVIKTFVPEWVLFIPLRMIFLAIPPFPPLTDAGILPLYDNLVHIVLSNDGPKERLVRFFKTVTGFLITGTEFVVGPLGENIKAKMNEPNNNGTNSTNKTSNNNNNNNGGNGVDSTNGKQFLQMQEDYLKCIEEGTTPIDSANSTWVDQIQQKINNNNTSMQCRLQTLSHVANIIGTSSASKTN